MKLLVGAQCQECCLLMSVCCGNGLDVCLLFSYEDRESSRPQRTLFRRHIGGVGRVRCPRAGLHPAPGRSGHHACRHYDRCARCIAAVGRGSSSHEAWPGSHQGTLPPLGRTVVERRQASAPDSGRAAQAASSVVRAAPAWCGTGCSTFAGAPLPLFLSFFLTSSWPDLIRPSMRRRGLLSVSATPR